MTEAVILSDKRTGSTFLQEALDSHPDITALDEMFMVYDKESERRGYKLYRSLQKSMTISEYLDWIASKGNNTIFRLMYEHNDYWHVLKHIMDRNMHILHLQRNPFDITLSHFCKSVDGDTRVYVDIQSFKMLLKAVSNRMVKYDKMLKSYDKMLTVKYESMIGQTKGQRSNITNIGQLNIRSDQITYLNPLINKAICDFLQVDNVPLYSSVTKKYIMPKEKKIINWKELQSEYSNYITQKQEPSQL